MILTDSTSESPVESREFEAGRRLQRYLHEDKSPPKSAQKLIEFWIEIGQYGDKQEDGWTTDSGVALHNGTSLSGAPLFSPCSRHYAERQLLSGITVVPLPGPDRPTLLARIQAKRLNSRREGELRVIPQR